MLKIPVEFEFQSSSVETDLRASNSVAMAMITLVHNGQLQGTISPSPGRQDLVLPNLSANDRDFELTLAIQFQVNAQQVEVTAVAKVSQIESIRLVQDSESHIVGTIARPGRADMPTAGSLGAAAVTNDCDISCLPPSTETRGAAFCVVCDCGAGQFELCC